MTQQMDDDRLIEDEIEKSFNEDGNKDIDIINNMKKIVGGTVYFDAWLWEYFKLCSLKAKKRSDLS